MVISLMAVGQKLTAAIMNQIIGGVNGVAMTGIVPTTVAGTGVVVAANGAVTFTNASTVSLNGVFSGTYDNYRITYTSPTRSGAASTQFRVRSAGVDATSATYDYVKTVGSGTTSTVSSSSSGTGVPLDQGVAASQVASGVLDLFGPALTTATLGSCLASVLASSALTSSSVSIAQESASAFDGFSMYPLSGTWSGTIRVYGYNNLT